MRGITFVSALCAMLLASAGAKAVNPNRQTLAPDIAGGVSTLSMQVANNVTANVVKGTPGLLYGIAVFNNNSTVYYGKVYDAATATCGTGTPKDRFMIPAASSGGAGFVFHISDIGATYVNGITVCITAGFADSDTTAPTASQAVYSVYFN